MSRALEGAVSMGLCLAFAAAIASAPSAFAAHAEGPLVLVADGASAYSIVVPEGPGLHRGVREAADLLREVLEQATGAALPVVAEGREGDGPAIYLGPTRAAERAGLPMEELTRWNCIYRMVGRDLFIVGEDTGRPARGVPLEYMGTLKAATLFLEDHLGVRFLLPGPNGIHVPRHDRLEIPSGAERSWRPRLQYVTGRTPGHRPYAVANNYLPSSIVRSYGGHSYYDAVPRRQFAASNPEYFALIGGVRQPAANHLCVSNPDVQRLMAEEMERALDGGAEWVELAPTDGYVPCECAECRALHSDPGERVWIVHRRLAEEMKERRPGKKVMMIAYPPTIAPPVSFDAFPDNVVMQLSRYTPEEFDRWAPFGLDKTVYVYNWGAYHVLGFAPKRTPRYAGEQIRLFERNGVQGIYLCGAFEALGLEGPAYYVYGRMMGDPSLHHGEIEDEFYRLAYGEAQAPMRAFFNAMHERLELYSALHRPTFRTEMEGVSWFRTPEDALTHFFPPQLLVDMGNNLERAKAQAEDPAVQARIRLVEYEFRYVRNLASIFHLYRAYRLTPNWQTFDLLAEEIEARHALLDEYFPDPERPAQTFEGWPRFFGGRPKAMVATGGNLRAILSAPVNWDTALLREKGVLPGVGVRTAKVRRIEGVALDGEIDGTPWDGFEAHELHEIGMGEMPNAARFKVAYDDENLYFAFECELAGVEHLHITPHGRDGRCFQDECVEVFIDPVGQRERYYHFIFNPVPNSFYDARRGFIDDPIHPLYGRADVSWDGEWDYAARIDVPGQRWTAEMRIPFATLGVERPNPGETWTMNVGRENFPVPKEGRPAPILSLWSPNLESRSFHETSTFGEIVFE